MGKVLLLGGSPMIGKSTAARMIAAKYGLPCISTDDIGEIVQTAADIRPMRGMNYLEYYESTALNTQIDDLLCYHKHIGKAIRRLTEIHSDWECSMVLEGYAIYPDIQPRDNTDAIWLIADEALPADRLDRSPAFASASEKAKSNYLARALWHNNFIEKECIRHHRKYLILISF